MRILAIRGRNLASLEGDFEVRFDAPPLRDVGIFAIAGPTGAGKSTLLDALCLALYDRTPRLDGNSAVRVGRADEAEKDRLGDQDTRALLRRGAGEGRAEVDFVGRDGRRYRATWAVRRARGAVGGRLQGVEVALTDLETGAPLAAGTKTETLAEIARKVGLPFDQFRRSVLLAQGDFAAFLKASAGERADLLERMTGTELYARLSVAAFRRAADEDQKVAALVTRLGERQPLSDDARAALEADRATAERDLEAVAAGLATARAAVAWHAQHAKLAAAAATAATKAAEADRAWAAVGGRDDLATADGVAAAERAVEALRTLDTEVALARTKADDARTTAGRAAIDAAGARTAADAAAHDLAGVRTRLEEGRAWLAANAARAPVADAWITLRGRLEGVRKARARAARAETDLGAVRAEAAAQAAGAAAAERERQAAQAAADGAERALAAAREAAAAVDVAGARAALDGALGAERALLAMQAAARSVAAHRTASAREREDAAAARTDAAEHDRRALAAAGDERVAAARLDEARAARERTVAARSLASHRASLVAGAPCPLCGATSHPYTTETPALDANVAALDARIAALDHERAAAHGTAATEAALARGAERRAADAERRAVAADGEAAAAARAWTEARAAAPTDGVPASPDDPAAHTAALAAAAARIAAARRATTQADEAQGRVTSTAAELERRGKALSAAKDAVATHAAAATARAARTDALERERAGACAEADEALAALEGPLAPLGAWRAAFDRDPGGFLAARDAEVRELATRRTAVERDEANLPATERRARETHAAATDRAAAAAAAATAATAADDAFRTLAAARAARFAGRPTKDVADALDVARRAHAARHDRARDLATHEATARPVLAAADAATAAADLETRRTALDRRLGELGERQRADDHVRTEVAALTRELEAARAGARTWQELSALIGSADGKKLRVFAQSLTLTELVATANAHLAGLRPRYRLARVPDTDLDLQVIDRDLGDEVRSIASLSGGETFLVSLALALGLSSLSAQDVRLDSLFVDEGFGTLDADTLESAIAVLDALQAEGRQVGLISHVPGLAERLGARVEVRPVGVGTSRVRVTTS